MMGKLCPTEAEVLLRWLRDVVWVNLPVKTVRINKLKAEGQRTLDGSAVHLQTLGADADVGAAFIELLARLVVLSLVGTHLAGVNCQTCLLKFEISTWEGPLSWDPLSRPLERPTQHRLNLIQTDQWSEFHLSLGWMMKRDTTRVTSVCSCGADVSCSRGITWQSGTEQQGSCGLVIIVQFKSGGS
ncbi:hypothetical protein E2C01_019492 [Portunus trituberculatus]|uniref:Uncharacterized protein n=1 Tax=Portunus trituberculatus TaxID=210409 RepID=A0A5B7DZ51_PORTR|nr:hypothetical protein [Portunus trituberculatus]